VRVASIFGIPRAAGQFGATPQVVLTGGVRTPSDALVGPIADIAIRSLHVDLLFLGCHGIDPVAGLTTPNLAEAETNRAFVQAARRVTVVADHTKWGIVGLSSFAELDEVDTFITDGLLHEEARALLGERVGELVIADDESGLLTLPVKTAQTTSHDRLVTGFQEICAFIEQHERPPEPNPADMAEFKLYHRLQAILDDPEQRAELRRKNYPKHWRLIPASRAENR